MNYGGHLYIMTNYYRTTFYIGVNADLVLRIMEHMLGNFIECSGGPETSSG